ncbi:helix-turn-helix transcriptional regulator [Clostridium botulinum]|nr:helix-turn-helix transcriptional regulator [Clostridium botulinum]
MKLASYFILGRCISENRIKELRAASNMTQQQLADLVSVSSRTIISLEKGQYNPSIMLAYKIARVFNTTIEELYCLKENLENEY